MPNLVKFVFVSIGVLMLSVLLYIAVFGEIGRTSMWNALEPGYQTIWGAATYHNGTDRTEVYDNTWDDAESQKIEW